MTGKLRLLSVLWLYHLQKKNEPINGISVVICSRNDVEQLRENLHLILEQDYPTFEVIVVDDASTDGTAEFLQALGQQFNHLKIVRIEDKQMPGKKIALQKGISQSQYPFLLLTDADCKPASKNWIKSNAAFASHQKTVVLGYGKHQKTKGFLNRLIRFDTATIAIQYMNKAMWKYPYMGVGRNLGYSKDLATTFEGVKQSLASGDDDLFIQAISNKVNFKVNLEPESFTISKSKTSWQGWLIQKARHTTTAPYYRMGTIISLFGNWFVGLLFYTGFFIILLTNNYLSGLMLLGIHTLSLLLFNGFWMKKLGEKDLILFIPILNFIYIFVQPVFVFKSMARNKREWN